MTTPHRRRAALLVLFTLLAGSLFFIPSAADAQTNPYQRGPTPTASALQANGPYSYSTSSVSSAVSGFGGGTVYYPTGTSETFGGIAVSPGYTASSSTMAWYGRRLASHGFVVIVIDTNSTLDQPNSRGTQLLRAADWLASSSPTAVRARLDSSRMAVAGHSMGGGGSIAASNSRSSLKASNPLTPWHTTKTWSSNVVPQLIIGAENDSVASTSSHAIPLYNGIRSATPKMYVELARASHFAPNSDDATISRTSVAFMKRWVDNDARYNTFLCGNDRPRTTDSRISDVRDNCSLGWGSGGGGGGTTTTQPATTCVRATNSSHESANRAVSYFSIYYARGSGDRLGYSWNITSLQQTGTNSWTEVSSC
jgi:dienelactone hydrolase